VAEADDGVTALDLIRTHLPQVALISAHDESAIVYSALQAGAAGFIPKESSRGARQRRAGVRELRVSGAVVEIPSATIESEVIA
jgi:DNA-binding NarL/FixJ family response regulator